MVTNEDQLLVEPAEVMVTPWAIECDAPLEHRSRDVNGSRNDAVKLACVLRPYVDDDPAVCGGRERLWSLEPCDPLRGLVDQTVEGTTIVALISRIAVRPT